MLAIRLSEEQYQLLRQASLASGARSLSDYARDFLFPASPDNGVCAVTALKQRLELAETEIRFLRRDLQNLRIVADQVLNTQSS